MQKCLQVGLSIVMPAIWSGADVFETLCIFRKIVTGRMTEWLLSLLLLAALIALAECLLLVIVAVGAQSVLGVSRNMVSDAISFSAIPFAFIVDSPNPYTLALAFGAMIGLDIILALTLAMSLMGINLIYLRITKSGTQSATPRIEPETHQGKLAETAPDTRPSEDKNTDEITESVPVAPQPAVCPQCLTKPQPGDRFCGECGARLQESEDRNQKSNAALSRRHISLIPDT